MIDVTIGVTSFNELQNIGSLLDALTTQQGSDEASIDQIIVSDDSNDGTDRVVREHADRDQRIELYHHSSRRGKPAAINEIFANSRGEIVALFDADVMPIDASVVIRLVSPMLKDPSIGVCGGLCCALPPRNLMGRVAYLTYRIWQNIRKTLRGGSGFFSVHGKILAVSSLISRLVRIPVGTLGDDGYIYLSCLRRGGKVHFASDAIVYYQETQTLRDYMIRRARYEHNLNQLIATFGHLARKEVAIPRATLARVTLHEGLQDPLSLFIATILVLWSKRNFGKVRTAPLWAMATSTKVRYSASLPLQTAA